MREAVARFVYCTDVVCECGLLFKRKVVSPRAQPKCSLAPDAEHLADRQAVSGAERETELSSLPASVQIAETCRDSLIAKSRRRGSPQMRV